MRVSYRKVFSLGQYQTHTVELGLDNVKKEDKDIVFKYLVMEVNRLGQLAKDVTPEQLEKMKNSSLDPSWLESEP